MRNTPSFIAGLIALAAFCLATSATACAAGLGEVRLLSDLGQPLSAEIEILALQAGDEDLAARLAPSVEGDVDPALNGIQLTILRHDLRRPVLRLSTSQPVNAPYLELLVELKSNNGRVVRRYTMLLDPSSSKDRQRIVASPVRQ